MADLRKIKQMILTRKEQEKRLYREESILDEDFPYFYTSEVLQMLDISRTTLFRIRREVQKLNSETQEHSTLLPKENTLPPNQKPKKTRYSVREIEQIKQYIRQKNAYVSPLEQIEKSED